MTETIKWSGYEWLTRERWGSVHPDKPDAWYDPDSVEVRGTDLILKTQKSPKIHKGTDLVSRVGVGLVSCTEDFGPGYFEIEAKLPRGPKLWPAFWMWSTLSWPPEIDVFEAYSNRWGSYLDFTGDTLIGNWWNVKSNIHYDQHPHNKNIGAKKHWMGWKDPSKTFNKYGVRWAEKSIQFYFNGKCIDTFTDPEIMKQFSDIHMQVIINASIRDGYPLNKNITTEMVVKSFKYTPHEHVTLL